MLNNLADRLCSEEAFVPVVVRGSGDQVKARTGYCIYVANTNRTVASIVHESFGSTYLCCSFWRDVGEIYTRAVRFAVNQHRVSLDFKGSGEPAWADLNFRILRRASVQEVQACLKRIHRPGVRLMSGYWHEVHGD